MGALPLAALSPGLYPQNVKNKRISLGFKVVFFFSLLAFRVIQHFLIILFLKPDFALLQEQAKAGRALKCVL